ncbi:chromate transporter [Paenibacillus sp. FSL A5-0031]|uniref:chromate transporter n=1 Tax=Paenibacillus sp. FSL A5-0031 TaxID=1920420 RepID=UPI00096F0139|nr:chromate transporter [Paenibacillus sp. FSL A5-0031]OME79496.1 chromate transporter [Paenibacillus sp. FSL A5-0031]
MLWELFITFFKIGSVSFGGGYAVIPLIQYEIEAHGWLTNSEFQEAVSLAGMAPGPIATNSATLIGYKSAGLAGAVATTSGMILPSLAAVILQAAVFFRQSRSKWFRSTFYGLRPIITGLIIYAAIYFGFLNRREAGFTWKTFFTLAICSGCMFLMIKYKLHPIAVIAAAGAAGIILF